MYPESLFSYQKWTLVVQEPSPVKAFLQNSLVLVQAASCPNKRLQKQAFKAKTAHLSAGMEQQNSEENFWFVCLVTEADFRLQHISCLDPFGGTPQLSTQLGPVPEDRIS